MKFAPSPRFYASLAALIFWAILVASCLYWVWRVQLPSEDSAVVAGLGLDSAPGPDLEGVAAALGAAGGPVATGSVNGRFALRGVITHGSRGGAALISVDGIAPKPVRVGQELPDAQGWTLASVWPSGAELWGQGSVVSLAVPKADRQLDARAAGDVRLPFSGPGAPAGVPIPRPGPPGFFPAPLGPQTTLPTSAQINSQMNAQFGAEAGAAAGSPVGGLMTGPRALSSPPPLPIK